MARRKRRGRPPKEYCILCKKELKKKDKKYILAIEKPIRMDIYVHRSCRKNSDENQIKRAVKRHINSIL